MVLSQPDGGDRGVQEGAEEEVGQRWEGLSEEGPVAGRE